MVRARGGLCVFRPKMGVYSMDRQSTEKWRSMAVHGADWLCNEEKAERDLTVSALCRTLLKAADSDRCSS